MSSLHWLDSHFFYAISVQCSIKSNLLPYPSPLPTIPSPPPTHFECFKLLELIYPYTLVGPPVKRPVLTPLAVYSSRTVYIGRNNKIRPGPFSIHLLEQMYWKLISREYLVERSFLWREFPVGIENVRASGEGAYWSFDTKETSRECCVYQND